MKLERQQKILDILSNGKYASVEFLSKTLYVSMPTIRRDLAELEEMGFVVRSHGGVIQRFNSDEPPLPFRTKVNMGAKLKLAKAAAQLLADNMVVFLDESSTTSHIVEHLAEHKNIKVVTNSMVVLNRLAKLDAEAFCLGGIYSKDTMAFFGSGTEDMMRRFAVDIMFFASSGLNDLGRIVDFSDPSTSLRRVALEQSEIKVYLCDQSKFGHRGTYSLMDLKDVDYAFFDAPLPAAVETGNATISIV